MYDLQKKLDSAKEKCANELPGNLWSIRTTKKTTMGETHFMLTYGSEAIPPIKVDLHLHCVATFQEALNNLALREALDLLPSIRGDTYIREALYKLRTTCLHNQSVKEQPINVGELVLH